jgi:Flp pilus assembly pilin Flp
MLRQTRLLDDSQSTARRLAAMVRDERGASFVEYIIIVGVVAIVGMAGFKTFGFQVRAKIDAQSVTVSAIQSE